VAASFLKKIRPIRPISQIAFQKRIQPSTLVEIGLSDMARSTDSASNELVHRDLGHPLWSAGGSR
jgi:hypothetical protein